MILPADSNPRWPWMAAREIDRWHAVPGLIEVHHIGSTSVPGLIAKPVIDLLPVFHSEDAMDAARRPVEDLGYEWMGPFGLPGRRYVRRNDPSTGKRLIQAHCYAVGSAEIARHVGFRDALRKSEDLRAGYAALKRRCAQTHPDDMAAYTDCKSDWIKAVDAKVTT